MVDTIIIFVYVYSWHSNLAVDNCHSYKTTNCWLILWIGILYCLSVCLLMSPEWYIY